LDLRKVFCIILNLVTFNYVVYIYPYRISNWLIQHWTNLKIFWQQLFYTKVYLIFFLIAAFNWSRFLKIKSWFICIVIFVDWPIDHSCPKQFLFTFSEFNHTLATIAFSLKVKNLFIFHQKLKSLFSTIACQNFLFGNSVITFRTLI
jgi:hypothetical protein